MRWEGKNRTASIALLLAAASAPLPSAFPSPQSSIAFAEEPNNLPDFRRVLLRPEQLPGEFERVRRGVLRQLPKTEFDDLVNRAGAMAAASRDPPRLVEAKYGAVLVGESLVGTAAWKILHRHVVPGLVSLDPFSPALRMAAWDDGTPALIGDFDSRPQAPGVELFVGRPGEQRLNLDWSVRGIPGPGGLRFDLRLPPCAVAVMEFDLPADREPEVPSEDGLTTGPFPGPTADRRVWKIAFANAAQIDLTVRPTRSVAAPLILTRQRTRQDLSPGQTACEFTFDLEAPHGGVRELAVRCDPGFHATEANIRNLDRWELEPPTANDRPRVVIRLREPLRTGTLTLQGFVPTAAGHSWTSPSAAVIGAMPRGEVLTVRVHPDLRLDELHAGSFRLVDSTTTPDRSQVLTWHAGLLRAGQARPVGRVRTVGPDYNVRERLWWTAGAGRMTLVAQLAFEVARGPVFQVPLRLSEGWEVDRIESDPPDLIASAEPPAGPTTTVELQRPLTPTSAGRLTLHLVRRHRPGGPAEAIPFPDVVPLAAHGRVGTLAVRLGPGLDATVTDSPPAAGNHLTDRERAPWGDSSPDYVFAVRGPPTDGVLHLSPRPARYQVRSASTVRLVGPRATVTSRVWLESIAGGLDDIAIHIPGTLAAWEWQVVQGDNRVRSVQPLPVPPPQLLAALAARSPWHVLTALGLPTDPSAGWWRVTLDRPSTKSVELEAHATIPVDDGRPWAVPLVRVPSAEKDGGEITVDVRSARGWRVRPAGLTDVPTGDDSPWRRTFRYGESPGDLTLMPGHDDGTRADRVRLETSATDSRQLVHRLSFRLWDWPRTTVPIDLPPDAVARQIRVNGVAVPRASDHPAAGTARLEIPAPAGARTLEFDVVYTTPRPATGPLTRLETALPRLPAAADDVRQLLCLPAGLTPLGWRPAADDEGRGPGPPASEAQLMPAEFGHGTFWEPAAEDGKTVWLIRSAAVTETGIILAIVGLFLARAFRGWPARRQWSALIGWLGISAGAAIGLPGPLAAAAYWPFLAATVVAVYKLIPRRPVPDPPTVAAPRSSAVRAMTAVWIAATIALPTGAGLFAEGPAAVLVYLVPGPADAPQPRTVLAPADLINQLRGLAGRDTGLTVAAWLDARYDGRINGSHADFTAELHLHSFAEDPPPLVLPLAGVQLGEATLDGTVAFLRATGDRYLVPVRGRGPHTLRLAFTAPCAGPAEDRELRFGVPETPISHLRLFGPTGATNLHAVVCRGGQRVEPDGDRPRLEADLGRVGTVQARWGQGGTPRNATIRTQETYLWDLAEMSARLLGAVRFTVGPGTASTLSVALPNDLEVAGVAARPVRLPSPGFVGEGPGMRGLFGFLEQPKPVTANASPSRSGDAEPLGSWLRDWRVEPPNTPGSRRMLVLEFAAPVSGAWQVSLELVPRGPFGPSFRLPFPSAVGGHIAPPVFAWRADGLDLVDALPDSAVPLPGDLFLRDFWGPAKVEAAVKPPTKAYQRKTVGAAPALRLHVISDAGK